MKKNPINYSLDQFDILIDASEVDLFDYCTPTAKERLYEQKQQDWGRFGYSKEFLENLKDQNYWEEEYNTIPGWNEKFKFKRGKSK